MDDHLPPDLDPKLQQALEGVGKEFETGKLTIQDVLHYYTPKLMETWKSVEWDATFTKLRNGDSTAILTMIFSLIIGGLVAKKFLFPMFTSEDSANGAKADKIQEEEEEAEIVLRDFTLDQLRVNDGLNGKPIYIALRREVFDVSNAKDFYGEGCSYHCFAGREASRAMAKLSFAEEDLANGLKIDDLGPFDRSILDDWYEKFKYYKCYPVVGRVSEPPTDLKLTLTQLQEYDGKQDVPAGREDAPIYISIRGKILDVSYGGKDFYSGESGYAVLAGRDATRALAKMSLDKADYMSSDLSDLTKEQLKTLGDWEAKLTKKYPCVGILVAEEGKGEGTIATPASDETGEESTSVASAGAKKGKAKLKKAQANKK